MNATNIHDSGASEPQVAKKLVCAGCVGEEFLNRLIVSSGREARCAYCEAVGQTITIQELSDRIRRAFDAHYERTPTEPEGAEWGMLSDPDSSSEWERRGEDTQHAVETAAVIESRIAEDVLSILRSGPYDPDAHKTSDEREFDEGAHYARKEQGIGELAKKWFEFEQGVKTEARFFSRAARSTLEEVFCELDAHTTTNGCSLVVTAGPDQALQHLYRARVFAAEEHNLKEAIKYPWKEIGPPPSDVASAGRMNPRGISVFYGAMEEDTALAEVRPPVGSQVAMGRFAIVRHVRLLDLDALNSVETKGSIFDVSYAARVQRGNFLRVLSSHLSRAVMPNEAELEYLGTQAVAEYLATELKLDGVIFASTQVAGAGHNVVLFRHSARVVNVSLPRHSKVQASTTYYDGGGEFPSYQVLELVPAESVAPPDKPLDRGTAAGHTLLPPGYDSREPVIALELESVVVHHITGVRLSSTAYKVHRRRVPLPSKIIR